ncbi:uncharacterized protein LOC135472547 [Liolophura sinensis]|uniref:uncharacterized protein LOC135472547 n=1 Tax=Liolophura sinensis TaxID=3198878 RepID=UPI003158AD6C
MADSMYRSTGGPVRPGLVSYGKPDSFRYTPAHVEDQFSRSYMGQGRGQGEGLKRYIDRVTSTWEDLDALALLPINSLPAQSVTALEKTLEKLLEFHTFSKTISKDHDHLAKVNRSLSEEKEVLINEIRERDTIIQQLQSSLKAFRDSPRTGLGVHTHTRQGSDGIRRLPNNALPKTPGAAAGMDLLTLRERVAELEDQLNSQQSNTVGRMSPEKELERIDEIQAQFDSLESFGLNQMKQVVDHVARQLPDEERFKVVYGILVVALDRSGDMLASLKTAIRKLINQPDRYLTVAPSGGNDKDENGLEHHSSLIVRENVKMFENKESGLTKDPRQQARISQERINNVYNHIRELLNETVDSCKLHALEKEVTDVMKSEYGATLHASLWFDSKYTKFLADCCRLAWKISLTDRDIELNFAPFEVYNEKRHHAFRSEPGPRSRVDYFAWPILVDVESKYVLHKGRAHFS